MSIALTCDCGARYEVEDLFAGQEVSCPECHHPTRVPLLERASRRVSLLALYSLVLAIVGAFTLVGSVAGAILAIVALVRMQSGRVRPGGAGYALAALGIAVAGAATTLGILHLPAASQLVGWQRRGGIASRIDLTGPLLVGSRDNVCVLTRPPGWGKLISDRALDPAIDYLQSNRDLILAEGRRAEAYIDIQRNPGVPGPLRDYGDHLALDLQMPPPGMPDEDEQPINQSAQNDFRISEPVVVPAIDGYEGQEWTADLRRGNQTWRWLLRAYRQKRGNDQARPTYVIRAYAPLRRFAAIEPELRRALESIRFPP